MIQSDVIDLKKARVELAARRGYRNWITRFDEAFDVNTRPGDISLETLSYLAKGKGENTFCLYDLIMNLLEFGSGFELNELDSEDKMTVIDRYLFLLDIIRYEYMKRVGWLQSYPGENLTLVEVIFNFKKLGPLLQARLPLLSKDHPDYSLFLEMNTFEKTEFIRKLIPEILKEIERRPKEK
jgi:hypothetical protein